MSDYKNRSFGERWNDLQPSKTLLVWSCIGSVAAALVVGFVWGGWVTGATARSMAATAADQGRHELASVICVDNFLAAPGAQAKLVDFKAIGSAYAQRQFIETGGWAVMPDKAAAARQSADLCAKLLAVLEPVDLSPVTAEETAPATVVH